jgi:simple sugar transport system ATP-binding protein
MTRDGVAVPAGRRAPAAAARTGYIPEDRQRDALVASMSAGENLLLGRQHEARFRRGPAINRVALTGHAGRLMRAHDVRPPEPATPAGAFSGGNQQKLVVAREMEEGPGLVVAAHPTRGLDLKAAGHVHAELRRGATRVRPCCSSPPTWTRRARWAIASWCFSPGAWRARCRPARSATRNSACS